MTELETVPNDSRVQRALDELRQMIQGQFPDAQFRVSKGEDPDGLYLDAIVDLDDPDVVMDLVVDRLLELQIDEQLPIQVVPLRTPERAARLLAEQSRRYAVPPLAS